MLENADTVILIGNIVAMVGACIMVLAGFLKKKNQILIAQCIQFAIMGVGNLILGGVTGFITNLVSIVRNLITFRWPFKWPLKLVFIGITVALTIVFNGSGLIAWLPAIAAAVFTWFLDTKSEVILKLTIIFSQALWLIYDYNIKNYVSMAFDLATMITNLVGISMILLGKDKRKETAQ